MNLTNVLGIWAGYSLNEKSITGDALKPYIDDALAELEVTTSSYSLPFRYEAHYQKSSFY